MNRYCHPLFFLLIIPASPAYSQTDLLTWHNGHRRSGVNLQETILTQGNVNSTQFGKLFSHAVDGYVYAQPLYVSGVPISGKGAHNAVFVATEHDSVYAFDADSNAGANATPLWQTSFINPGAGITTVPYQDVSCSQITPEIGITGTPVISLPRNTLYVVAMTKEVSGQTTSYVQRLHALDIRTGAERPGSPVVIQAASGGVTFAPKNYKSRPGLLLLNGVVYTAWSSHCDIGTYHGWLIGYDAGTLAQVSVYNATPRGNQGSFWAAGAAPAVDARGNIFISSGNGTFDANTGGPDLGESYIRLTASGGLAAADYFTPFNVASLNAADLDTGSSGILLLPNAAGSQAHPHLMISAGKEGRIYLIDRDNMGGFNASGDQVVQELPGAIGGLFSIPVYFNGLVYFSGSGDRIKAFSLSNATLSTSPVSQSAASFGYPGSVPSVSSHGALNGIIWTIEGAGSAVLHAYAAGNLAAELYNSNQNAARDNPGAYVKFSTPTIVNGKVCVGTQTALAVYGLL